MNFETIGFVLHSSDIDFGGGGGGGVGGWGGGVGGVGGVLIIETARMKKY